MYSVDIGPTTSVYFIIEVELCWLKINDFYSVELCVIIHQLQLLHWESQSPQVVVDTVTQLTWLSTPSEYSHGVHNLHYLQNKRTKKSEKCMTINEKLRLFKAQIVRKWTIPLDHLSWILIRQNGSKFKIDCIVPSKRLIDKGDRYVLYTLT